MGLSAHMAAEPSDQMGDIDSPPWAGLWAFPTPSEFTGIIVVRQLDGSMSLFLYEYEDQLAEAWGEMQITLGEEPAPEDLIIWCIGTIHGEKGDKEVWHLGYKEKFPESIDTEGLPTKELVMRLANVHAKLEEKEVNVWLFDGLNYMLMERP